MSILLLRKGPQDLPGGMLWLILFVLANYLLNLYQYSLVESMQAATDTTSNGSVPALLDILLQIVLVGIILQLAKCPARIYQTLTALFGTGLLFSLMLSPILQLSLTSGGKSGGGLLLALMAWNFAVEGNIFKHALSISMMRGVGLAIGLFFVSYFVALTFTNSA